MFRKSNCIFENYAIFEKRIGVGAQDKELFVINELINEQKYISFDKLIKENGGLLRIPFLTKTSAITYIIKYWSK